MTPTDPRIICVNMLDSSCIVVDLDDKRSFILSLDQILSLNPEVLMRTEATTERT